MFRSIISFILVFAASFALADTQRGIELFNQENYKAAEHEFIGPADAGDPVAIRYLANMLYFGRGVEKDRPLARILLRNAFEKGDTASGVYLASLLSDYWAHFGEDESEATKRERLMEVTALFEQTYSGATGQNPATNIVQNYVTSEGKIAPRSSMILWFKRAVLEGHAESAWHLAGAYARGNGVNKDEQEAFYWAEYAAFLGFPEAQTSVGQIYAEGRYGPVRTDEGMALIVQAAKERHNPAMLHVAEYYTSQGSRHDLGMAWRVLDIAYGRGMERSDRSHRLFEYLLEKNAHQYAKSIEDYAYNGHFETLIGRTTPDYQRALEDFKKRIKPHKE